VSGDFGFDIMSRVHYFAREAAATLLKLARATSDPKVAAGLVERAAELKDRVGELPPQDGKAPDVKSDG
jgi:hypothetical protein